MNKKFLKKYLKYKKKYLKLKKQLIGLGLSEEGISPTDISIEDLSLVPIEDVTDSILNKWVELVKKSASSRDKKSAISDFISSVDKEKEIILNDFKRRINDINPDDLDALYLTEVKEIILAWVNYGKESTDIGGIREKFVQEIINDNLEGEDKVFYNLKYLSKEEEEGEIDCLIHSDRLDLILDAIKTKGGEKLGKEVKMIPLNEKGTSIYVPIIERKYKYVDTIIKSLAEKLGLKPLVEYSKLKEKLSGEKEIKKILRESNRLFNYIIKSKIDKDIKRMLSIMFLGSISDKKFDDGEAYSSFWPMWVNEIFVKLNESKISKRSREHSIEPNEYKDYHILEIKGPLTEESRRQAEEQINRFITAANLE